MSANKLTEDSCIAVVGLGYVGLPLAVEFGKVRPVVGFDIDEAKLRSHRGWSPSIVSYDGRPNVVGVHRPRETRGRSLILNGLMVRSIAHEICTLIAMTGSTSGVTPDWPAVIAARDAGRREPGQQTRLVAQHGLEHQQAEGLEQVGLLGNGHKLRGRDKTA